MTETTDQRTARSPIERLTEDLRKELKMYEEAALYDACMSGPVFKGWNRSALDRARRATEDRQRKESENAGS